MNASLNTDLLDRAIRFAVRAHAGTERRGKGFPYIVHPMEAMSIVATLTSDQELLAAAALHDVVEDTAFTAEDIRREFGDRVADLVIAESDVFIEGKEGDTWHVRKQAAIDRLRQAPYDAKIVAMGDKLSNMRAIARDYARQGDALWNLFHTHDPAEHEWHYRGLAESLKELEGSFAYEEFVSLIDQVFPGKRPQAIRIDLSDYEKTGGGANGDSYNCISDPTMMLKLYLPGREAQSVNELMLSRKVYNLGIPTPEPGDYVTDGERFGIRFRRIKDKKSFSRAVADEPEKVAYYAEEFAKMCLDLHRVEVDPLQFESVKEHYYKLLKENPFFTAAEKDALTRFIADAPDTHTAIHGDLQYSNVIFSGDRRYFIDLGDFCYGYKLFDVGMVYLCTVLDDEDFIRETFHMPKSLALRFWECFAPAYFGADRPLASIEEEIRPYAGLKTIISFDLS